MNKSTKILMFLIVAHIFGQFTAVESKSKAKKGKVKAFGVGILAGGLAGAAIGHVLTSNKNAKEVHHYHHIDDPNASVSNPVKFNHVPSPPYKPTTVIEKGEILENGCYKQIVKEQDQYYVTKFTVTEQLICPQSVPLPANQPTVVHQVPVVITSQPQPIAPTVHASHVPIYVPQSVNNSTPTNVSQVPPVYTAPIAPLQLKPQIPTVSVVPVVPVVNPLPTPADLYPKKSVTPDSPQVIILSKKTEFYGEEKQKKNAGSSLFTNTFMFLFSAILLLIAEHFQYE